MPSGVGTSSPWAPPLLCGVPWGTQLPPTPPLQWVQPLDQSLLPAGGLCCLQVRPARSSSGCIQRQVSTRHHAWGSSMSPPALPTLTPPAFVCCGTGQSQAWGGCPANRDPLLPSGLGWKGLAPLQGEQGDLGGLPGAAGREGSEGRQDPSCCH